MQFTSFVLFPNMKHLPTTYVVTQFHHTEWTETSCPSDSNGILSLLEDVNKTQRRSGNKPITVMCK